MKSFHLLTEYLARQYAKLYPAEMFVAVAGVVGKTSTVNACAAVLSQKYKTLFTRSTFNQSPNIPSALFKLNPSIKKVILEMEVEHKGRMDFYLSLVKPKIVILTRVSYTSKEVLEGIREILLEQEKLIESLDKNGIALLNWDDPNSRKLAESCNGTVLYYGMDPKNCTVWASNPKIENFTTSFELNLGVERVKVNFQLLGLHQVYSALAAALLGVVHNIPLTRIKLALEKVTPSDYYLQAIIGPNGSVILDNTYDSSLSSLDDAIDTLLQIPARRRVIILGEMKEVGIYSEQLYRKVAQRIYKEKLDFVFLGQGDTQIVADELKNLGFWEERMEFNLKNSELVSKLLKTLVKGDICLIQGSRAVRLDEVVKRIAKKT